MVAAVPPLGGGRASLGSTQQPKSLKAKAIKVSRKTEGGLKIAAKATSVARSIGGIVDSFKGISSSVSKGLKLTKGASVALTPFTIYHAAEDTIDVVKKKNLKDKIWATFSLLVNLDSVVDSIAATCGLVYAFRAVSSSLVDWIPIYSVVSFFVGFISLGTAAKSVGESGMLVHELRQVLKKLDAEKFDADKAKILGDFLKKLAAKGVLPLLKKLMISKKATLNGLLVENRIRDLARTRLIGQRVKEAEVIVRGLAGRAKVDLGFKVADLATRVVAMVGKGFAAFAPILPVGCIILASTGLITLSLIGSKAMLISKNPFDKNDPKSRSRAVELVGFISNGISHLRDHLHTISLWPKAHPAVP